MIKPGFNESSWTDGKGAIGWDDGDDVTKVTPCSSVYLHITFKTSISKAYNLIVDYDDGFVAYLNGVEIACANLVASGTSVSFDALTDRSHEAQDYRDFSNPVKGFYIDNATVSKAAVAGQNILAIEVHNDSVGGSDLTFKASLMPISDFGFSVNDNSQRFFNANQTNGWQFEQTTRRMELTKVMRDNAFVKKLGNRWKELRRPVFQTDSLVNMFDSIANSIQESRIRNYEIWPVISQTIVGYDNVKTYEQELNNANTFLKARLKWIDENINKIYNELPAYAGTIFLMF